MKVREFEVELCTCHRTQLNATSVKASEPENVNLQELRCPRNAVICTYPRARSVAT